MVTTRVIRRGAELAACLGLLAALASADQPPPTGPETEKRFPPLQVPAGFQATLFACDPLVEYPSVISAGPRPGAVFVAADYLTGLGTDIIRRDEVRLLEDSDGDGYADRSTLCAQGFNSIQGLCWHDGALYVMHAPYLSVLRDRTGTGRPGDRRDLLTGLGLPPEQNPVRLHCANGVTWGHDGWLYLAVGDNGVDVPRPEGDRLVLQGGGILRCRPDGRDLHLFAAGLRNIYDVALDEDLEVFIRDNENDGGDYKIRLCHSFHGADHGYPYLYYERPEEALPPLADLGLGSSAGGVFYLERHFPADYHGNLFFCEWGRSLVRYAPRRQGSAFAPVSEQVFASGADNDPYGFKPTDVVVQRDGSLIVSDWADGQRPRRGRGRIYYIRHVGNDTGLKPAPPKNAGPHQEIAQLDSPSYYERCAAQAALEKRGPEGLQAVRQAIAAKQLGLRGRLHAIWIMAHLAGPGASDDLLALLDSDPEPRIQAQAVRAIADLADPVLVRHRLDAGAGDPVLAGRLAQAAVGKSPAVQREVVVALGRLRWKEAPAWLARHVLVETQKPDAAMQHAALQAMRRSENWSSILNLLDGAGPARAVALRALADRHDTAVVDGLIERLRSEHDPSRRREYADWLTRVHQKPGPWVYWGYRPPPRPPNRLAWERTDAIAAELDRVLTDPDRAVRLATLRRMQRERVPVRLATLGQWLRDERQPEQVAAILDSLADQPRREAQPHLEAYLRRQEYTAANGLRALEMFAQDLDEAAAESLLRLAEKLADGPVLAEALRRLGKFPRVPANSLLAGKLDSPVADVRAAAIEALGQRRAAEASEPVLRLVQDKDAVVRRAAATAAGKLGLHAALEPLLKLARDPDPGVRRASLEALCQLREPRVVPLALAALPDRATQLTAVHCLEQLGGPEQAGPLVELAKNSPSTEVLTAVVRVLNGWSSRPEIALDRRRELDRAVAEIHGASGVLARWSVSPAVRPQAADGLVEKLGRLPVGLPADWRPAFASGTESRVNFAVPKESVAGTVWLAAADIAVPQPVAVEFLASSGSTMRVWLNGQPIHQRKLAGPFRLDSERFEGALGRGVNRVVVEVGASGSGLDFHLRFRRKSATAEHERLTRLALTQAGNPARGRTLFFNVEKSLCLKCHRLGDQGERIGPELSGVGSRFSRIYLVESILEPSRTIAPSYGSYTALLSSGKVFTGVKVAETDTLLTLADNQGQKHELKKSDIEELQPQSASTMPEGLEKRLSEQEFIDLIAFLASQKEAPPR